MSAVKALKSSSQSEPEKVVDCIGKESEVELRGKDGADCARQSKERNSANFSTKKQNKFKLSRSRLVRYSLQYETVTVIDFNLGRRVYICFKDRFWEKIKLSTAASFRSDERFKKAHCYCFKHDSTLQLSATKEHLWAAC